MRECFANLSLPPSLPRIFMAFAGESRNTVVPRGFDSCEELRTCSKTLLLPSLNSAIYVRMSIYTCMCMFAHKYVWQSFTKIKKLSLKEFYGWDWYAFRWMYEHKSCWDWCASRYVNIMLAKRRCRLDSSRVCACVYLCVCVYVCVSYDVLVCVSICLFVCMSVCLCVCESVSLCFSVFACCMQLSDGEMLERGRGGGRGISKMH